MWDCNLDWGSDSSVGEEIPDCGAPSPQKLFLRAGQTNWYEDWSLCQDY